MLSNKHLLDKQSQRESRLLFQLNNTVIGNHFSEHMPKIFANFIQIEMFNANDTTNHGKE